jgi:tetratricopeptide (TPR) repeat protein
MRGSLLILGAAGGAALVLTLAVGTTGRATAPSPSPADTAITSRTIAYLEARLTREPLNYLAAGQLVNRYILRFSTGADLADLERAETLSRRLLVQHPDRASAASRLAGVLLMRHDFAGAYAAALQAVAADSTSDDAWGTLLEAALASGRYDVADRVAQRIDTGTLVGQVRRAQWLDLRGSTAAAEAMMDRACRELHRSAAPPPVEAWCLTQLAGMRHSEEGPDAATALLRRALAVQPGFRGAIEGLANLAAARGRWAEAHRLYRRILSDAHPDIYLRLAEAAGQTGRRAEAERLEARFLATAGRPEHEALFGNVLALHYAERGRPADLDTALVLARRDIARRPTVDGYDLLAWIHYRRGEIAAAVRASDRSLEWGSPQPTVLLHRALILRRAGRDGEADSLLARSAARPTLLTAAARAAGRAEPGLE